MHPVLHTAFVFEWLADSLQGNRDKLFDLWLHEVGHVLTMPLTMACVTSVLQRCTACTQRPTSQQSCAAPRRTAGMTAVDSETGRPPSNIWHNSGSQGQAPIHLNGSMFGSAYLT